MATLSVTSKKTLNVLEGPLLGKVLSFTIPVILTNVLQWAYNAADSIVVGRFCGKNALAAVTGTATLVSLLLAFTFGLSSGAAVLIAQAIGEDNPDRIKKSQGTAFTVAFLSGLLLTAIGLLWSKTFLTWMGTPEDIIDQSALYLRIYFASMPFNSSYLFGSAMLRAAGDSKRPLIYALIAGAVNVVLNLVLVLVFDMGVAGVGVATVASMVISAVLTFGTFRKGVGPLKFTLKDVSFHWNIFGKLVSIGLPAGLQSMTFHISNTIIQSSINSLGSTVVAANGAASSVDNLQYQMVSAFYQTVTTFVGQCFGAKRLDRIAKCVRVIVIAASVTALVTGVVFYAFGRQMLSLYIDEPDPAVTKEIIESGMVRVFYIAVLYVPCAFQEVFAFALKSMNRAFIGMVASVVTICGSRITWTLFVFPQFRDLPRLEALGWLYVVYVISWILATIAQTSIYFITKAQLKKKWAKEQSN